MQNLIEMHSALSEKEFPDVGNVDELYFFCTFIVVLCCILKGLVVFLIVTNSF